MGVQTEQWNTLLNRFHGLYTAHDSDKIPDGYSPNLLNVRVTGSHFRGSTGYSLVGTRNATAGEITAQYTYRRNDGQERMLRVRDNGSSGTLEWFDSINEEWYTLLSALTTGKVMGFVEFNTSSTNQCIFCNGVQNMSVWAGSITRLTSSLVGGEGTINVADTTDFPASGTIIYNGTEIAYSAKTGTTFTVVSAHASSGANDGVALAADDSTHSAITKGNILHVALDRLLIAGQPGAPNALDGSDEGTAFTFTGGANRADSFSEEFFNIGGAITGLSSKGDEVIVLGQDGADGFSFSYPTSTTKAPIFREIFRSPGKGCTNAKSVFKVNEEIYFTNKNGIVAISDVEGSDARVFTSSITRPILPTLKLFNFSEASSLYYDKESILLVACKSEDSSPANDVVLGLEFYQDQDGQDKIGFVRFDWPSSGFAVLADELYFGSSLEQNSFKGFDTYQNDGAPRTVRYATKRFDFRNPFQEKSAQYMAVRGYIKDSTDVDVSILYNSGFLGSQAKTISSTGAYVSQQPLNTIGAFAIGTNPIGATLAEVSELKRFLVYLDLGVDYAPSDIQLLFESDTDGGTFLIDYVGMALDTQGFAVRQDLTI